LKESRTEFPVDITLSQTELPPGRIFSGQASPKSLKTTFPVVEKNIETSVEMWFFS